MSYNVYGLVINRSPSNISGAAAVVHPCDAAGWLARQVRRIHLSI